jgi:hypothetical protein
VVSIHIFDATGRRAHGFFADTPAVNGENTYTYTHNLPAGMYFYIVWVNGKAESNGKFTVR